jgi:hypothetical protein
LLFGLLGTVSYLLIDELDLKGDRTRLFYAVAAAAALAMLIAGSGKKSEAADLLYSSIRQQLVQNADKREYGLEYFLSSMPVWILILIFYDRHLICAAVFSD